MSDIDDMAAFVEERLNEEAAEAEGPPGWQLEHWTAVKYADDESGRNWRVDAEPRCVVDAAHEQDALFITRHDPARVLAGVEARRRIVADCRKYMSGEREFNPGHARYGTPFQSPAANLAFRTLRSLASEYAGHPAHKAEWKP